jgi:hypothetical protein
MTMTEPLRRQLSAQQEQPRRRRRWGCYPRPSVQPREQPLQGRRQRQLPQKLRLRLCCCCWRYRYRHPTSPSRPPSPLASASHLASWPLSLFLCLSLCVYAGVSYYLVSWPGGRRTECLLGLASYRISFLYLLVLAHLCYQAKAQKGRHKDVLDARRSGRYADLRAFLAWLGGGGPTDMRCLAAPHK